MVPVITAIVAAALAGAIAVYRERRIELWRLVVAARVLLAALEGGFILLEVLRDSSLSIRWERFRDRGDPEDVEALWGQHREVLAAGLRRDQWEHVVHGVDAYLRVITHAVDRAHLTDAEADPTSGDNRDRFRSVQERVKVAGDVLRAYCERPGLFQNPGRRATEAER